MTTQSFYKEPPSIELFLLWVFLFFNFCPNFVVQACFAGLCQLRPLDKVFFFQAEMFHLELALTFLSAIMYTQKYCENEQYT